MSTSTFPFCYHLLVLFVRLHGTQFVYNTDFNASCYSRIGGFSGAQIYYDSYTLSTTIFDRLAIAGDITITGNHYFFLQIDFMKPIDLHSAQLIWRPSTAKAADTDQDSMTFTQISYHNLFTDAYDVLSVSQTQWDPIVTDYMLFNADTNSVDLIFTNSIIFQLTFKDPSISDIHLTLASIVGEYYTWSPTNTPSNVPTNTPTYIPTTYPSEIPTETPTKSPTQSPTVYPTKYPTEALETNHYLSTNTSMTVFPSDISSTTPTLSPTVHSTNHTTTAPSVDLTNYSTKAPTIHDDGTNMNNNSSFVKYSTNIYPLSYRNEALLNFTVPGDKPYCLTCVLSWSNVDALIEVNGCDDTCDDGVWTLKTSGRLADWQQTYGRIEIWEVDAHDMEHLRWRFEFQWNTSECLWFNDTSKEMEECNYLPLTNTDKHTAMFEFTMSKKYDDDRNAPFIVVWYDLLSIPYSLRPSLQDRYHNLTLINVGTGKSFAIYDLWSSFKPGIIATGSWIVLLIFIALIACLVDVDKKKRHEFMLKTYNLRTAYTQSTKNEVLPKQYVPNQSKFVCKKHGALLLIIFVARLIYMAVFTVSFFCLAFKWINTEWFDVLSKYDLFAANRDRELTIISSHIEAYYQNETEKMQQEMDHKQTYCYTKYINQTNMEWNKGALSQYNHHSQQMQEKSLRLDLSKLHQSESIYIAGNTACDITSEHGAHILESDPIRKVFVFPNGTYKNTTYWRVTDYDRNWDNFTQLEQLLTARCLRQHWCDGWTWIDPVLPLHGTINTFNTSSVAHYYLLSSLSYEINSDQPGLCYTVSRFDANAFNFGSIETVENRTEMLREKYLNEYQHQVQSMSQSLNGIWNALQSLGDNHNNGDKALYTVIINNDPRARGYDIDIQLKEMNFNDSASWESSWYVIVTCPGCPDGNFTSPYVQQVKDYIKSNISDYMNSASSALHVNISNLVTINPAIIEFPVVPIVDFPIQFDIPMNFSMVICIGVVVDIVLLIYRCYGTVGILAQIIRGKDVEIGLKYLSVKQKDKKCCSDRKCTDKWLSSFMWVHDQCYYLRYNRFKLWYWITAIIQLFVVAILISLLYFLVDQVLPVYFIHDLGTFNLMTTGITTQRAVRNQVLSTKALSYNNYTIYNIEQISSDFAKTKNMESYQWNINELKRINEWNAYFCNAYTLYQSTKRDIAIDGDILYSNNTNILDQHIIIDIELPIIQYTDSDWSFWEISWIEIEWNTTMVQHLTFTIESKLESTQNLRNRYNGTYAVSSSDELYDIQSINIHLNETRFIRITFSSAFEINEIKIYGSAPVNKIVCDTVQFDFWLFDASNVKVAECPSITPIFGNMYRGFVPEWINNQLLEALKPFTLAMRNIVLSPFLMLFVAISALIMVYLLGFIVEWLLIRLDLFRSNVYSKVTLISVDNDCDLRYIATPITTSSDDDWSEDECGGAYMSPKNKKPKYSRKCPKGNKYLSPLHSKQDVEIIEMEQIVLKESSPNDRSNARELARMLFDERQYIESTESEGEMDSYDFVEDKHGYDDHVHDDRCKQQ